MATAEWRLRGDFLELCNCKVACPCIIQGLTETPTEGNCDNGFAWHIEEGEFNGIALNGLNFACLQSAPGIMAEGNWTTAIYVDERADQRQRDALEEILSGRVGGPMERFMALTGNFLGTKHVPIDFKIDGHARSVSIPEILDFSVEGVIKPGFSDPVKFENVRAWAPWVAFAKGTKGAYTDNGLLFENTGRTGHYGPFVWPLP